MTTLLGIVGGVFAIVFILAVIAVIAFENDIEKNGWH